MLQWKWLAVLGCCDGRLLFLLLLLGIEEWVRESLTRQGRGERKKIIYKTTVTMHIILHINSVLDILMRVVFEQKCVKSYKIYNFFYFTLASASPLRGQVH